MGMLTDGQKVPLDWHLIAGLMQVKGVQFSAS